LSYGKRCTASSSLEGYPPASASDENIRSWWSAQTGDTGEWFQMDLGKPCKVHAIQVNFAEEDCHATPPRMTDDFHQYKLLVSADGQQWRLIADKSANRSAVPHDYIPLPEPDMVRFLKVENVRMPAAGKFAIRDLRVFGHGGGKPPARVDSLKVTRHRNDDRNVSLKWMPTAGAEGYLLRYGIAPDKLWQCVQVQDGSRTSLTLHTLNRGVKYHFRLDAFNDSGLRPGMTYYNGYYRANAALRLKK